MYGFMATAMSESRGMESSVREFHGTVVKYIPDKLYGFVTDDTGSELFFHLGAFRPGPDSSVVRRCSECPVVKCGLTTAAPPPILGEPVTGTCESTDTDSRPRATLLVRTTVPVSRTGVVTLYDATRGYGFVTGDDMVSYHLHRSEVTDGRCPLTGGHVTFFAGTRNGRPRACHVRICRT